VLAIPATLIVSQLVGSKHSGNWLLLPIFRSTVPLKIEET